MPKQITQGFITQGVRAAASQLLTEHQGVARSAEAEAWAHQRQFAPDAEDANRELHNFFRLVAMCIAEGSEQPRVDRRAPQPVSEPRP